MVRKKSVKTKGKLQFSKYFQKFEKGDRVAVIREPSVNANFSERMQGCSGVVEGRKGKVYIVKVKDRNKEKIFLIEPIHLKKLNSLKKVEKKND